MPDKYVTQEVKKIYDDKSLEFPKNMALASAWILGNKKGINLKILDVKGKSSLSDYFVLASAQNIIQARAMAEEILGQLRKHGAKSISIEGLESQADWILLDLGDILVHIFLDTSREVYDLDSLWSEADQVEIPQSYYFSTPETSGAPRESPWPSVKVRGCAGSSQFRPLALWRTSSSCISCPHRSLRPS